MGRREELLRDEEERWAELTAEIERLSPEERERPGITPDGSSSKDLVWHCAAWCEELATVLEEMRADTFRQEDHDLDVAATDARNRELFDESRLMSWAEVEAGAIEARRKVHAAWAALPEIDDEAAKWFAEEGPEHYTDHLADLRRWMARLRAD